MNNSKTKWLISFMLVGLMLTIVGVVNAQSSVTAVLSVDDTDVTVGDVIPLTLHVTHPAGWRVIIPMLEKQWGEFELRSQSTPAIVTNGDGTETTSQIVEVVRMRPGEVRTPALTLSIADDQGDLQNVDVAPVSLLVQSVLVAGDTTLRDLKPQADLITAQTTYWPLIAAGLLGVIIFIGYVIQRRRNRPTVDKRTPRERALDTLRALGAQNPQTTEELKAACTTIAGCLRGYVASTAAIPAYDLTTNELARQLKMNDLPADWITGVIDVLRVCDSVKFARDVLELTTIHGMTHTTELLVEQYPPASAQSASPQVKQTQLNGVTA